MATAPDSPKMLGRYELLFLLGQGGMGEVHLARLSGAAGFEKLCIVKTILPQMQADPQFVDRFHHEARVLVHLTHANIAQVYDMGDYERTLYMAIEYVAGVDLARIQNRLASTGAMLPVPLALFLGQRLAEALGYAHRKAGPDGVALGIVHRDVSPQNVMVSYEGEVKVIDFGLAKSSARSKHTMPSTVMGKLGYMSPEQAMAKVVDHRSDIFSAGIVVWEMIAGRPLYQGATMAEMVMAMARPTIPNLREIRPEVSPALNHVVMRALATEPGDRYNRCDDFARALNELAVRESLSVGAEDVGNAVRAMCAEEFAAERKLQSKLSLLRKKNRSAAAEVTEEPHDGTFLRGGSGAEEEDSLTPAQKALSAIVTPRPKATSPKAAVPLGRVSTPGRRKSEPSVIVGADAEDQSENTTLPEQAFDESLMVVPKSRAPMMVLALLVLGGVGGAGYWAYGGTPVTASAPVLEPVVSVKPLPIEPAVEKPSPEPKHDRVVPPAQLFKVVRQGESPFIVLEKNERLVRGERLRLVGDELEGTKEREVHGTAAVVSVDNSLVTLVTEEDEDALPKQLFAFRDSSVPKSKKPIPEQPWALPNTTTVVVERPSEPKPEPSKPKPEAVKPITAPPLVNAAEPVVAQAVVTTPVAPAKERRTIKGSVTLGRVHSAFRSGSEVSIITSEADTLTGCTVWLPNGKSLFYDELKPKTNITDSLDSYKTDPRALTGEMVSGKWALVQCKQAPGYFYFKQSDR